MEEKLETIRSDVVQQVKERYIRLFKVSDEAISEALRIIDYGRLLPDIWQERRAEEVSKKVARTCKIDENAAASIMNITVNIQRGLREKRYISKHASDLKKNGVQTN